VIPVRVVVVGAGVVGLLTAVECVRAGARVDLADRGGVPSPQAASYDSHRVVRTLHRGDAPLTLAAARLPAQWSEIERLVGIRFLHHTGVLTAMAEQDVDVELKVMREAGARARVVSAADLSARYPHVRLPAAESAVLEPEAVTVQADRAVTALARWLRGRPEVRIHSHHRVDSVEESGAVRFADGTVLRADHVVVAAGPWSREVQPTGSLTQLTLKRQTMLSYAPTAFRAAWADSPAILGLGSARDAWVMPPIGGGPARLSAASACRTVPEMGDRSASEQWRDHLVGRFSELLPGFDAAAVVGADDGYYLTDESGPGPALLELDGAATVYAACGGMSFKFGPVAARVLADRALGRPARRTGLEPLDRPRRPAAAGPEGRTL
jgi:sarcosine oxidase